MAMMILAGKQSRINAIFNDSVSSINGIFIVLHYPVKNIMAEIHVVYHFNGVLMAK